MQSHRVKKSLFNQYLIILFSGVGMGLTVPPVNAWILAWMALVPLWVVTVKHMQSPGKKFLVGAMWGIGYHGTALSWITGLHPLTWMGVPWLGSVAIAIFAWLFITLWGALLVGCWTSLFAVLIGLSVRNQSGVVSMLLMVLTRLFLGMGLWCLLENIWMLGPLWWTTLAYTQSPHNLVILHLGQLSGTSTVTSVIVGVNALIAEVCLLTINSSNTVIKPTRKYQLFYTLPAALFICTHLLGFYLYIQPLNDQSSAALRVGVIQGNVPNRIKFDVDGLRRALTGYTRGYEQLADAGVDAVLTPEGALPFFLRDIRSSSLVKAVEQRGVIAWIGGFAERANTNTYANSLFTFGKNGQLPERYEKHKLVPLGEYIPLEEFFGQFIRRLSPVTARQVPGANEQIFSTPWGIAIAGICYESAFPELFRRQAAAGGEFILTASNNDPYSAAMQMQHHAHDLMRAIETDRWAVRATNTGLSGFVNPHGKTLWISPHRTYAIHSETIYRRTTQTPYVKWGDWLTPTLLGLAAICWLLGRAM